MIPPRTLARLFAVAIVMIAACLGAPLVGVSSAQAHQGHAHRGPSLHSSPAALTLAESRMVAQGPRLAAVTPDEAPAARPCDGLCCQMGASCCVPGLLPESLTALPSSRPARRLAVAEDALPAGITPDSPARPPRPFV